MKEIRTPPVNKNPEPSFILVSSSSFARVSLGRLCSDAVVKSLTPSLYRLELVMPSPRSVSDFESWQQCIRLYCLGKENGENILQSIDEGPFKMGKFRETLADGALGPERDKVVKDLTPEEKERYKADIHATNILLQGLLKDIYTLINHYTDAKDIWDNMKMLLEGFELTTDEHES
ncbi:hypothetical protein Tco_1345684 [Tanacetum coccineum]